MKKGSKGVLIYIRESHVIRNDWSGDILTCIWTEFPGIEFMCSFKLILSFERDVQTSTRINAVFD